MKVLEKLKNKKTIAFIAVFIVGLFLGNSTAPLCANSKHDGIEEKVSSLETEVKTLNEKVESAKPWFEMKDAEKKAIEEENAKKKAEEEAKKKAAEEEQKRQAEEEAKKGYDTGITYSQLARTPDDYKGKKVKFEGKVIQVMQGNGEVQIRLAVNGNYDHIVYGVYNENIVSSRVLEDDYITIRGLSAGLLTYKSTMGGSITIPSVLIQKIDM